MPLSRGSLTSIGGGHVMAIFISEEGALRRHVIAYAVEKLGLCNPFTIFFRAEFATPPPHSHVVQGYKKWEHQIQQGERQFILYVVPPCQVCVMPLPLRGVPLADESIVESYGSLTAMIDTSYYPQQKMSGVVSQDEIEFSLLEFRNRQEGNELQMQGRVIVV
jgi:hypothetical protein